MLSPFVHWPPMNFKSRHLPARPAALWALALLAMSGCSRQGFVDHSQTLAKVDGQRITQAALDAYQRARSRVEPLPDSPSQARALALDEMVNTLLLADEAKKEGLDDDPDVHFAVVQEKNTLLADAAVRHYLKAHPITSADLAAAYRVQYRDGGVVEYEARHILVSRKSEAEEILRRLKAGARFSVLARQMSEDRLSAANGGELGWFTQDQMLPAFVQGIASLKQGEITPAPLRTEFGWHIVQLQGRRVLAAPPFADSRSEIYRQLVNARVKALIASLRRKADITAPDPAPAARP